MNALSLTSTANDWLMNTRHPRVLHVFDRACNLINESREILSIVTPQIGNGPFNLVIEDDVLFSDHLRLESSVSISLNQLILGDLTIHTTGTELWNPRPNWEMLHAGKDNILNRLTQLPIINYPFPHSQFSNSLISDLCSSLITTDVSTAKSLAAKLAGLGIGLTPSGDDFIMGALYATWIIHPHEIASTLAKEVSETAAPLTTSLSSAWLRSAGKGEAGILWHKFFQAVIIGDDLHLPITQLLSVGETSGADALAGFFGVLSAFKERIIDKCPS